MQEKNIETVHSSAKQCHQELLIKENNQLHYLLNEVSGFVQLNCELLFIIINFLISKFCFRKNSVLSRNPNLERCYSPHSENLYVWKFACWKPRQSLQEFLSRWNLLSNSPKRFHQAIKARKYVLFLNSSWRRLNRAGDNNFLALIDFHKSNEIIYICSGLSVKKISRHAIIRSPWLTKACNGMRWLKWLKMQQHRCL